MADSLEHLLIFFDFGDKVKKDFCALVPSAECAGGGRRLRDQSKDND